MTMPRVSARPFQKGLHHEPFDVETSAASHGEMLIDFAQQQGKLADQSALLRYFKECRMYIQALGRGELPMWHELAGADKNPVQAAKDRQERQSKLHRKLVEIHACKCGGDTLNTLDMLAEILEGKGVVL